MIKSASQELRSDTNGNPTDDLIRVYTNLSKGGVAMIITGLTYVLRDEQYNPNGAGMYDDSQIPAYQRLTSAVHDNGAKICAQLALIGSNRNYNLDKRVFAPSAAIGSSYGTQVQKEMTKDEIKQAVAAVAAAAVRAQKAGFDAVELHLAHEYLACQFLMPYFNRRKDEYGGSRENRARFAFEIVEAVRAAVGPDFPVLAKFASTHERGEQGCLRDDIDYTAKGLAERGLTALDISGGNEVEDFNPSHRWISDYTEDMCYFAHDARFISMSLNFPLILTGGSRDIGVMEKAMQSNDQIVAFGIARPLINDPSLPNKWMADVTYKAECISCNWCRDNYGGQKTHCQFRPEEA
jgi:2,4-dienoyl-CoA reductase-like NADH-dependent reductase (Old Yellow Enzyme family)